MIRCLEPALSFWQLKAVLESHSQVLGSFQIPCCSSGLSLGLDLFIAQGKARGSSTAEHLPV